MNAMRSLFGRRESAAVLESSSVLSHFLRGELSAADLKQRFNPAKIHELANEAFMKHRQPTAAAQLWKAAAAAGHPDARYSLATYSIDKAAMERKARRGRQTPMDLKVEEEPSLPVSRAVEELRQLVEAGHGQAHHALALLQREGTHGVEKSAEKALQNFRTASVLGVQPAIHAAASMMMTGEGTEGGVPEVEEAIKWFQIGAAGPGGGDPACHLALGIIKGDQERYPDWFDLESAFEHLKKAADFGLPQAKHNVACALREGLGCEKDLRAAVQLFGEAASMGYRPSMVNFALALEKGEGIEQDTEAASAILARLSP